MRLQWRVIITPDGRVPVNLPSALVLAEHTVCPCEMGVLLMRGTEDGCSCASNHSLRQAWRLVDTAINGGRVEFA